MAEYFDHFLIKIKGPKGQWTEKVSHHSFLIGRTPPCDIVLDATFISRKHARIFIENGALWIEDLKSSNGVFINGLKIKPNVPVEIDLETKISFGETEKIELDLELVMTSEAPVGDELKAQASLALGKLSEVLGTSLHFIKLKVERKEKLIERVRKEAKDIMSATRLEREELMKKSHKEGEKAVKKAKEQALKIVKEAEDEAFQARKELDRELRKKREEIDSQAVTLDHLKDEIEKRNLEIKQSEKTFEEIKLKQIELQNVQKQVSDAEGVLQKLKTEQETQAALTEKSRLEKTSLDQKSADLTIRLDEGEKTLQALKVESQSLNEKIASSQDEKSLLQKMINELLEEKKLLRNFIDSEKDQIEKLKANVQSEAQAEKSQLLSEAEIQAEKIIASAKELAHENAQKVHERAEKELLKTREKAQTELDRILAQKDEAILAYEKVIEKAKGVMKEAEVEIALKREASVKAVEDELLALRAKALNSLEVDQKASEAKYREYLKFEAQAIQKKLVDSATTDLKAFLKDPKSNDVMMGVEKVLSKATQSVLLGVDFTDEELEKHLKERPTGQQQKNKKFFVRAAIMTMGVFLCVGLAPYFADHMGESARDLASSTKEKEIENFKELEVKREELNRFTPEVRADYAATYTDRVLHTEGYVENELKPSYREQWIVQLNEHLVSKLQLNEDIVVAFIAQEANLIRELKGVKDTINGQYPEPGIQRMRETEKRFMDAVKKLAKSQKNVNKILDFKKDFYLKNTVSDERLPAASGL